MIIINIFLALIIAIGFWRNTSKEHKRMIAKASLTKTVILFLLSAAVTFFYYKSYQVAKIHNMIMVLPDKGSYYYVNDTIYNNNGLDTIVEKRICPRDSIQSIIIYNKFNSKLNLVDNESYSDSLDLLSFLNNSGIMVNLKMDNNNGNTQWYPGKEDEETKTNVDKDIKHSYIICWETWGASNLLPFSFFKKIYKEDKKDDANITSISYALEGISSKVFQSTNFFIETKEIDVKEKFTYVSARANSKFINTLNFFSAADLSQCEFELLISPKLPIGTIYVDFNLPIQVSGLDNSINSSYLKRFTINHAELKKKHKEWDYMDSLVQYHITFPTLANLQLIRSLILTTLLTALLASFFKNLYYYGRNIIERRKRKQKTPFSYSRKMVLIWIPVGKIIVWTFIVAFAFLLILSILNLHYRIEVESVPLLIFKIGISLLLYLILLCGTYYFLYRKRIWKSNKIVAKTDEKEKIESENIDVKPFPETGKKSEETSKIEECKSNEITIHEDGQKPSRKQSQQKKGKYNKKEEKGIEKNIENGDTD